MKPFMVISLCAAFVSGCTEYAGRQTNCWTPAQAVAPVMSFANAGCDFVALPSLIPVSALVE